MLLETVTAASVPAVATVGGATVSCEEAFPSTVDTDVFAVDDEAEECKDAATDAGFKGRNDALIDAGFVGEINHGSRLEWWDDVDVVADTSKDANDDAGNWDANDDAVTEGAKVCAGNVDARDDADETDVDDNAFAEDVDDDADDKGANGDAGNKGAPDDVKDDEAVPFLPLRSRRCGVKPAWRFRVGVGIIRRFGDE